MLPKITDALLHHSAYIIVDGIVIKMEQLTKSQLRAYAVRLFEKNYSFVLVPNSLCGIDSRQFC